MQACQLFVFAIRSSTNARFAAGLYLCESLQGRAVRRGTAANYLPHHRRRHLLHRRRHHCHRLPNRRTNHRHLRCDHGLRLRNLRSSRSPPRFRRLLRHDDGRPERGLLSRRPRLPPRLQGTLPPELSLHGFPQIQASTTGKHDTIITTDASGGCFGARMRLRVDRIL